MPFMIMACAGSPQSCWHGRAWLVIIVVCSLARKRLVTGWTSVPTTDTNLADTFGIIFPRTIFLIVFGITSCPHK